MANFTGQLNANEIFGALYNMIISQEIYTDNIEGDDLVDKADIVIRNFVGFNIEQIKDLFK